LSQICHLSLDGSSWDSGSGKWGTSNGGSWETKTVTANGESGSWETKAVTANKAVSSNSVLSSKSVSSGGNGGWGSSDGNGWGSSDGSTMGVTNVSGVDGSLDNWLLNSVDVLLNDWGLHNLLDWADNMWDWDIDWDWDLNVVWLLDLLEDGVWSLNWGWDWDWDVVWDLVDLQLWDNVGLDWGDSGVSADWGSDLFLGDGVSWGWAKVAWCWWDSGVWGSVWERSQRQWAGRLSVDWGSGNEAVWGWLLNRLSSKLVLVSNLDGLVSC